MAGRIPQSFIDELLDRVDVVDVIDRRVPLKKAGRNFTACCPFHKEKTPSFSVNPDKQFYYCFGCGAGGNALGFVMDYDKLPFPEAVEALASAAGLEVPREDDGATSKDQRATQRRQSLYDALNWVNRYYLQQLRQHAEAGAAIDYLKQRGLSGEIARDFAIGYAPSGWDNLEKATANDQNKAHFVQLLCDTGMLITKDNGEHYDRFRARIMFPIRDSRGRVIAFGGRVLDDQKPKYLNSPETPIFHKQRELYGLYEARQAHKQLDQLLLVEGYMDVVALAQYGIRYAVATLGTASSQTHLEKIFRHCSKLVVCFDGDEAGRTAANRLLETALPSMRDGRDIRFLFLPEGEDPDTRVRAVGKTGFEDDIDKAQPLEQYLFDSLRSHIATDTAAGKAQLADAALPMISKLPDGVYKTLVLRMLGEHTGLDDDTLKQGLKTAAAQRSSRQSTSSQRPSITPSHSPSHTPSRETPRIQAADTASPAADPQMPPPDYESEAPWGDTSPPASQTPAGKTPAVAALSLLLHYPALGKLSGVAEQIAELTPSGDVALLQMLSEQISADPGTPTTYGLIGYWHNTPEGERINACAGEHEPPNDMAIAETELRDALRRIVEQRQEEELEQYINSLKDKPFESLNSDERDKLRRLLNAKNTR